MAKKQVDSADGVRVGEEPVPGLRLRCICRGHTGTIGRIAWSPCGRFIASPSYDGTIRIWDTTNGQFGRSFEGHSEVVYTVAWSRDSELLISGSFDKSFRHWNAKTGEQLHAFEAQPLAHSGVRVFPLRRTAQKSSCVINTIEAAPHMDVVAIGGDAPGILLWQPGIARE
jgi:WD40 repeat protein